MKDRHSGKWLLLGLSILSILGLTLFFTDRNNTQEIRKINLTINEDMTINKYSIEKSRTMGGNTIPSNELYARLVNNADYWDYSLRSHLLALPPSELLDLLERDEILVRDDGRDMIVDLASWCAGALMLQNEKNIHGSIEDTFSDKQLYERVKKAFDEGWCGALARAPDAHGRMRRLQELIDASDLPGQDRYERAMTHIQEAAERDDGSLQSIISSDRADLISMAMHELWRRRDSSVISDWTALDKLPPNQVRETLLYMRVGLECQQLGGCSTRDNPALSAACFNIGLHCDAGRDFFSIMRRSLSPAQFDALMMLMNGVNAYRRQHRG